ncbi:MAG: tetratricopeptide repeat protein [Planctomycetota bacterium]
MSGDFDVAGATQALELLEEEKLYGSLTISDGMLDLCCFFTRGGLRVISAGRELPSLRRRLVQGGLLTEEDARRVAQIVARAQPGQQREERDVLVQDLGLKPPEVDEVVRELLEDVILDCLFWEEPQYEVATGEPDIEVMQRRDLSALTLSIGVPALITSIKQRVRGVAEVRRTVSSMDVIVEPTQKGRAAAEDGQPLGEGAAGRARLRFLRTVAEQPGQGARELAQQLRVGELEVASRLHELSLKGLLEITRKPRDKKAELERIRQMEEAIDQALNQLLRRLRLAKNSAAQGDQARAARHMARAGGVLMEQGRADEAVRTFSDALRHSEDDLEAREGLVQGLWATNRGDEAARASEDLGRRYLGLNLPGRARRVLERALGFREETPTLELFVQSLVKLKRHKAASEAGQRLVNRLRREGRADDARNVATELMALGDEEDRRRLARAAGVSTMHLAALVLVGLALGAGYFPLRAKAEEQRAYRETATTIGDELARTTTWKQVMPALDDAVRRLTPLCDGEGAPAVAAREATRKLEQIRGDVQRARDVVSRLPWRQCSDVEELQHHLDQLATSAQSEALSVPLLRLRRELASYQKAFESLAAQLASSSGRDAVELARRIRKDYSALPSRLEKTLLAVQVVSEPPGASVEVDGIEYRQAQLNLPLRGTVRLKVSLQGHEPEVRELTFDDLGDEPRVFFKLERSGGPKASPTPPRPIPTQTPSPSPSASASPRTSPSPRPSPSPTQSSSGWTSYVMLKEGILKGSPPSGKTLDFTQEADFLSELKLANRFRALVQTVNEIDGSKVYLTGFQVTLYVRRSHGWGTEKPLDLELDERYARPVTQYPGGRLKVGEISRTIHADLEHLRSVVEEGIERRIRELGRREDR